MSLAKSARPRHRFFAPIDALIGMALLTGAALTLLPMMATLATFAAIAAVAHRRTPAPRRVALPIR